mgnify:CR=1 FL=1
MAKVERSWFKLGYIENKTDSWLLIVDWKRWEQVKTLRVEWENYWAKGSAKFEHV